MIRQGWLPGLRHGGSHDHVFAEITISFDDSVVDALQVRPEVVRSWPCLFFVGTGPDTASILDAFC